MRTTKLTAFIVLLLLAQAPGFGQVIVNECYVGPTDWLEILNVGPNTVNIAGYRIEISGNSSATNLVTASFTFPGGTTIASGELIVVTEGVGAAYPSVPPGTQIFDLGGNIYWHSSGVGYGGVCTLTNGSIGLDTVNWLSPGNANAFPPAVFAGSISSLSGDYIYRQSNNSPSAPADWTSDTSGTPGALNPGQSVGPPPIEITITPVGVSGISIDVTTIPPAPGASVINLFSLETQSPVGSGPLFGVGLDAFPQLLVPANPFQGMLNASGTWNFSAGSGVPPGLHVEAVSILVELGAITRISMVEAINL